MDTETKPIFGSNPPTDGRPYDCQCARCGSSIEWEHCGACGGEGVTGPGELYESDLFGTDRMITKPATSAAGMLRMVFADLVLNGVNPTQCKAGKLLSAGRLSGFRFITQRRTNTPKHSQSTPS